MSRLLFTMLFSPHGWAPPISWHMCNILRSPCLSLPTSWRFLRKKRARSTRYTPNLEREISNHRGLHNFDVTSFHRHLVFYVIEKGLVSGKKKKKKGRVFDYPDWKRGEVAILYLLRAKEEAISYSPLMRSFKITLLPCYSHFSHVFVSSLSLTIRRR